MSKQGLKLGAFVKYYLVSLASLSFLCLILYGLYSLNGLIPYSLDRTSSHEVKHYSGQTTSSVKKDGDYNGVLFLGIAPNDIYMYCIKIENIDFDNQKIDYNGVHVNLHNRGRDGLEGRATGAGYKCDLKPEQMRKISSLSDLKDEFEKEFGDLI